MNAIRALAYATFLGSLRARLFLYVLAVAVFMMLLSLPISGLGFNEQLRIVTDMAVGSAGLLGLFLTIYFGVSSISGEIEKRTVYNAISKPISRTQFVLGKLMGVWLTVAVALVGCYLAIEGVVYFKAGAFNWSLLLNLFYALFEMGLLTALAVFFSCVSKPLVASGMTVLTYLVGTQTDMIALWFSAQDRGVGLYTQALVWLIPNFRLFDIKSAVAYQIAIPLQQHVLMVLYTFCYMAFLLVLAAFSFQRRDLK
ncbi:MAG: ABC transporter permease [Myxococcota bacterium]